MLGEIGEIVAYHDFVRVFIWEHKDKAGSNFIPYHG